MQSYLRFRVPDAWPDMDNIYFKIKVLDIKCLFLGIFVDILELDASQVVDNVHVKIKVGDIKYIISWIMYFITGNPRQIPVNDRAQIFGF